MVFYVVPWSSDIFLGVYPYQAVEFVESNLNSIAANRTACLAFAIRTGERYGGRILDGHPAGHDSPASVAQLFPSYAAEGRLPQTEAEVRTWEHVMQVFGRRPHSIRTISNDSDQSAACFVKMHWETGDDLEFICAGGVLVGIPKK